MPIVKVYRNPHPYRHCVNANAVSVFTCCLQFIFYFSGSFQPRSDHSVVHAVFLTDILSHRTNQLVSLLYNQGAFTYTLRCAVRCCAARAWTTVFNIFVYSLCVIHSLWKWLHLCDAVWQGQAMVDLVAKHNHGLTLRGFNITSSTNLILFR